VAELVRVQREAQLLVEPLQQLAGGLNRHWAAA
jgi:hypothetical protein